MVGRIIPVGILSMPCTRLPYPITQFFFVGGMICYIIPRSTIFFQKKILKKIQNKSSNPLPFRYKYLSLILKTNKTMNTQEKADYLHKRIGVALVKALLFGVFLGSLITWFVLR
jgi:hypothetical protein